ncbi:DnaJ domain-containing protein [bacterium SCSIO 12741]|nr:DnaJ domain-containing protein [bacterium SCSIO 12741]
MRQYHLDILGLPPSASDGEIKKRYRELAMRYHPDVNQDPGAKEEFIRIHKAYEALMGGGSEINQMYEAYQRSRRAQRPSSQTASAYGYEEDQREAMRQRARKYAEMHQKEAEEIELGVFNMLTSGVVWWVVRIFALAIVIFGFIMMVDFILPQREEAHKVKNTVHYELFSRNTIFFVDGGQIDVPERVFLKLGIRDSLYMDYSPMLREFLDYRIIKYEQEGEIVMEDGFNFFSFYPLFPLLFFIPGFILFYKKNEVRFYLLYFVTLIAYPALILHYLIRENKFQYLIDFFSQLS